MRVFAYLYAGLFSCLSSLTFCTIATVSEDAVLSSKASSLLRQDRPQSPSSSAKVVAINAHGDGVQQPEEAQKQHAFFFKVHHPAKAASLASLYPGNGTDIVGMAAEAQQLFEDDGVAVECAHLSTGNCTLHKSPKKGPRPSDNRVTDLKNYDVKCPGAGLISRWKMGGKGHKLDIKWVCCEFSKTVKSCSKGTTEWTKKGSGNLMTLATSKDNKVGCTEGGGAALKSWKMLDTGKSSKVKIQYECCSLPDVGRQFGDECKEDHSAWQPADHMLKALKKHLVVCKLGHALFNWEMEKDASGNQFRLKWSCCPVTAVNPFVGEAKSCAVSGAHHVSTFDGQSVHITTSSGGGFFWVVKSPMVQVQSYYEAAPGLASEATKTVGVAFAGRFLHGGKLIVKLDVPALSLKHDNFKTFSSALAQKIEWYPPTGPMIEFNAVRNGKASWTEKVMNGRLIITRHGSKVEISFPLHIEATINQHSFYSDESFTMHNFGPQTGQCGANEKQRNKDAASPDFGAHGKSALANGHEVKTSENLFTKDYKGDHHGKVTAKTCPAKTKAAAVTSCRKKFKEGDPVLEDFFQMCILDFCNTPDKLEREAMALNTVNEAWEKIRLEEYNAPRLYRTPTKKIHAAPFLKETVAGHTYCDVGGKHGFMAAMPKSKAENRLLLEHLAGSEDKGLKAAKLVFLGAKRSGTSSEGRWKWWDGTTVDAGWSNFAHGEKTKHGNGMYLCMSTENGKWKACDHTSKYGACEEQKKYGRITEVDVFLARSACGEYKQMAMPRSKREQHLLAEKVSELDPEANMWLGGYRKHGVWHWQDGVKIGDYINWANGAEPASGKVAKDYLCIKPDGKWTACGDDEVLDVMCETKGPDKKCHMSTQDFSAAAMGMKPGPYPKAAFEDYCYYLAPHQDSNGKAMSCETFCAGRGAFHGNAGKCSALGTAIAAKSIHTCTMVLAALGVNLMKAKGDSVDYSSSSSTGCTFLEKEVRRRSILQAKLKKPSKDSSPTCEAVEDSPDEHRVCSCMDTLDADPYVAGHVLIKGETARISGVLSKSGSSTISIAAPVKTHAAKLVETSQTDFAADNIAIKITMDATKKTISRSHRCGGKWATPKVEKLWPFASMAANESFNLDVSQTDEEWEILIFGQRYKQLSYPRFKCAFYGASVGTSLMEVDESRTSTSLLVQLQGMKYAKVVLLQPDPTRKEDKRTMNSDNGCTDDHFIIQEDLATFYFTMLPIGGVSGQRCIRCELTPFDRSSNIFLENGKLVVTMEGNAPRTQTFDTPFFANETYDIAVSYRKKDKTVELYVNKQRVEYLHYHRALSMNIGQGQLACFKSTERRFIGEIRDFYVSAGPPSHRPVRGLCQTQYRAFRCPEPQKRLFVDPSPFNISCAGSLCDVKDTDTCCQPMLKCNKAKFKCPVSHDFKGNAGDLYCRDVACLETVATIDNCCDPEGVCTTYKCPANHLHMLDAASIFCEEKNCTKSAQNDARCCEEVERCNVYDCPEGMSLRWHNRDTMCSDRRCTTNDLTTCCAARGTCDAFHCPLNFQHRANAKDTLCTDINCTETNFDRCCVTDGICTSHTCPEGTVHSLAAESIYCVDMNCSGKVDDARCCEFRAPCETFECDEREYEKIPNASTVFCAGAHCIAKVDHKTCCNHRGFCNAFECPEEYSKRGHVDQIVCETNNCPTADFEKCCGLDNTCATFKCPASHIIKHEAADLPCSNLTCDSDDIELCCDRAAICTDSTCPPHLDIHGNASSLFCQNTECSPADFNHCCGQKGSCSTYTCPAGTIHKPNARHLFCAKESCDSNDHELCCINEKSCGNYECPDGYVANDDSKDIICPGFQCGPSDRMTCCHEAGRCSTYSCPATFSRFPNAKYLFCSGQECTHKDLHTCCYQEGHCTNYTCPNDWLQKPNAKDILCDKKDCSPETTPVEKCCAQAGRCNSFACPADYVSKINASTLDCAEYMCTAKDQFMCCDKVEGCSEHKCAVGFTRNANHGELKCKDRKCSGEDLDMCCVPEGHCHSFPCPFGMLHIQDEKLLCDDENCTSLDSNVRKCCGAEKKCNTYTCPTGFVHKDIASRLDCSGFQCGDIDRDTCCDEVATCAGYLCPHGTVLHWHPRSILCSGPVHTAHDALDCCASEGRCDTYKCPPGFLHRHNASDIFCEDNTCSNGTQYNHCCVEEGLCPSYHCPTEYVHKSRASTLFCEDWKCTEKDRDSCCDARGHCNEEVCPTHNVPIWQAAKVMCEGHKCLAGDYDTCCTEEGKCNTMQCPPRFKQRHNARDIYCSDKNCTASEDDYNACCAREDMCHSYKCPERYIHKFNAHMLNCSGFECTDVDRDTCCDFRAMCDSYSCDTNYAIKGDAEIIQCNASLCVAEDRDTCCDPSGMCPLMQCPEGFMHKADASTIHCADKDCKNTDAAICCLEKAKCLTHTCPKGYVHHELWNKSMQTLYCSGQECNNNDTDVCCRAIATCNEFVLPPGYLHKHNADKLHCRSSPCDDGDLHTCAGEAGFCSSYVCPKTFVTKHNAHHIECADLDCNATDFTVCCAQEGSCSSYKCRESLVHREHAETFRCDDTKCTKNDEDHCCQISATCNPSVCAKGLALRPLSQFIHCEGRECSASDSHRCCVEEGKCSSFKCPSGFIHRHDAASLDCPHDSNCNSTDFSTCCVEEGRCPTYTCPEKMLQKSMPEDISCREELCTAADKHVCCDQRQSCEFYRCEAGYVWKTDYESRMCKEVSCKAHDLNECCEAEAQQADDNFGTPAPQADQVVSTSYAQRKVDEEGWDGAGHRAAVPFVGIIVLVAGLLHTRG